jgi:hypothetical protein
MRFKSASVLWVVTFLLLLSCENYIIERAASDYFPLADGNWWRYASNDDTLIVEVEPRDTLLHVQCFPVIFGGSAKYLAKNAESIAEYIEILYNFSGDDYIILKDFIMRIEIPLVAGNTWEDSLIDSLNVFGAWIKAQYYIRGRVTGFTYVEDYEGDVYTIELETIETFTSPDTTIIDTNYVTEDYAPNIGLVRFYNEEGRYNLIEYGLQ